MWSLVSRPPKLHFLHRLMIPLSIFLFLAVPLPHHSGLAAAYLPDVSPAWMRGIINANGYFDSNGNHKGCVFYGPGAGVHARAWIDTHNSNPAKVRIWDVYDNDLYMNEGKVGSRLKEYFDAGLQLLYFQNQSQVFTEYCVGYAWVMMFDLDERGNQMPDEPTNSIWTSHEFKTIKGELPGARTSGVTAVERINPAGQSRGVIWRRAVPATFSGKSLRILPLGDSITDGFQSTTGNGYRRIVDDTLAAEGNTVDMVGSRAVGNWPDNQNEGWSGYTIAGLQAKIPEAVKLRPNAILLHIGTNDAGQTSDVNTLPGQLGNMIDSLFSGCPDAFVLVAKIIRSGNAGTQARVITYNNAIDGVVASRRNAGKHILVVDMFPVLPPSDIQDGIHPNDAGYQKMANVWLDGIRQANANGWIGTPATLTSPTAPVVSGGGRQQCKTSLFWYPANLNAAANEVATGAGYGSDVFPGITCSDVQSDATPKQCFCSDSTTVFFKGDTAACSDFSIPYIHAMHMVDMNGDGRADFVHVGDRGQVKAYYNFRDPNDNADKIVWRDQGEIATGIGCTREQIHFADLDGDGRADYLCVRRDSSVTGYRNLPSAVSNGGINWVPYGSDIASGVGKPGAGVRFADLSGDGRADYLYVYPDGRVDAWQNQPTNGDPARPAWLPQTRYNPVATGVGAARDNIRFADIDGDGRADYLAVDPDTGRTWWNRNPISRDTGPNAASPIWDGQVLIAGGVDGPGTQLRYADLNGDGRAEYIMINKDTSAARVYFNGCNAA